MWCFAFEIWYLKVISVERWFSPREAFENHAVNIHGKKRSFGQLSMSTPRTVALPKTVDSKVEIFSHLKTKHDHFFSSLRWRSSELRQRNVQFVAKSSPGIKNISSDTGILDISLILFSQLTSMIDDINYLSRNEMARHMESHQQNCKDCSFKCNNPRSLEMHKRAEHNFKCKKCKLTLSTKEALGTHTTVAHMFKCQKCGTLFEHKTLLEKHFRASHMFKCPSCPQVQFFFYTLEWLSIFLNIFSHLFLICLMIYFQVLDSTAALASHDTAKHQSCEVLNKNILSGNHFWHFPIFGFENLFQVCEDEFSWAEAGHSCYYTRNNIKPIIAESSW